MSKISMRAFVRQSRARVAFLFCLGISLLAVGLWSLLWNPAPTTYKLRITGGVEGLNRHDVVRYIQRHAHHIDLEVDLVTSEGTLDATRLLDEGDAEMAVVNGLIRNPRSTTVRQVSPITVEALHLLVKVEYADEVTTNFSVLNDLSLNIGPVNSETELLSRALLEFCNVSVEGRDASGAVDFKRAGIFDLLSILNELQTADAERSAELRAELPDVVIHSSTLPSPLAKQLIQIGDYRLIPTPFADAFSKITVEEEELDRDHLDQIHVIPTTIPAFMYGATPPIPETDFPTIGSPLILIAHQDVPAEVVSRVLPRLYEGPLKRVYDPPPIRDVAPTYPWHDASIEYRDRDKPILRADLADFLQRIFGIIAPLFGGCLALYGYYRWRQNLRFIEYFEKYQMLDRQAKGLTRDEVVTPTEAEEARRIEGELTKLQEQAVADFCRNYFYGDGVFENFLQLLAETRSFVRASSQPQKSAAEKSE